MKNFLYMNIYQDILKQLESGQLKPGNKLPTEALLSQKYGASRDTIRKALGKLESDGLIDRKASLGTFVKNTKKIYPLSRVKSFTDQMISIGAKPSSEILLIQLQTDVEPKIKRALALSKNESCYKVCRIRKADNTPMAYEIAYIRQKYCLDIVKYLNNTASIYHIFSSIYKLNLTYEDITLEAELPSIQISEYLGISTKSPVLKMKCTLYMHDNIPLYYVDCYYSGDKYIFSSRIQW